MLINNNTSSMDGRLMLLSHWRELGGCTQTELSLHFPLWDAEWDKATRDIQSWQIKKPCSSNHATGTLPEKTPWAWKVICLFHILGAINSEHPTMIHCFLAAIYSGKGGEWGSDGCRDWLNRRCRCYRKWAWLWRCYQKWARLLLLLLLLLLLKRCTRKNKYRE